MVSHISIRLTLSNRHFGGESEEEQVVSKRKFFYIVGQQIPGVGEMDIEYVDYSMLVEVILKPPFALGAAEMVALARSKRFKENVAQFFEIPSMLLTVVVSEPVHHT